MPLPWTRVGRWRRSVQLLSALALNSHFTWQVTKSIPCPALNCYSCPLAACACPIGSIQHFAGSIKFPFYVLGAVALVGALIGRGSCGWFCPFGLLQELLYKLPVPKLRVRNRFNWTRYTVLALLVVLIPLLTGEPWFCKLCPAGTLEAGIPLMLLTPWMRSLIGILYWIKLAILVILLAWMSLTPRPFCRWLCPLGALWSPFNPVSSLRLAVRQDDCVRCNRCQEVCPVELRVYEAPCSGECIRCLECVRVCPVGCITVESLTLARQAQAQEKL